MTVLPPLLSLIGYSENIHNPTVYVSRTGSETTVIHKLFTILPPLSPRVSHPYYFCTNPLFVPNILPTHFSPSLTVLVTRPCHDLSFLTVPTPDLDPLTPFTPRSSPTLLTDSLPSLPYTNLLRTIFTSDRRPYVSPVTSPEGSGLIVCPLPFRPTTLWWRWDTGMGSGRRSPSVTVDECRLNP